MRRSRLPASRQSARSRRARGLGAVGAAGLTLLETMVALVILGLVVLGYLELFTAASRSTRQAEVWSQAVAYAEDAMEALKIEPGLPPLGREPLAGGFERTVEARAWDADTRLVTVIVHLPQGGSYTVSRLFDAGP